MELLKCSYCRETVDPKTGLVVYVGYGDDWRPAPANAFCSEEHQVEWVRQNFPRPAE